MSETTEAKGMKPERKQTEEALRESEERYRRLVELSPDAIIIHSEGRLIFANEAAARLAGARSPEEIVGRPILEFVHPDSRALVLERLQLVLAGKQAPLVEEKLLRLDGTPVDVEVTAMPFALEGRPAVQAVIRNISERKRAEKIQSALYRIAQITSAAEDMGAFYRAIHEIVGELMYAKNFYIALYDETSGSVSFPYFVDEMDREPPAVKPGKTLTEYVLRTGEPLLASPAVFARLVESGEVESVGAPSLDWLGAPLKRGGKAFGVLVVQSYTESARFTEAERDLLTFVSRHVATALDRKRSDERIKSLAYHDTLTGLPNRQLCTDRLSMAIAHAHRQAQRVGVIFLDLDRFKLIIDSLGHKVGDRLLQAVAERLKACLRDGDTVARLGGDEFALVLPSLPRATDVVTVAEKVLESLRQPITIESHELFVTSSLGISLYPDDGRDAETVLKNADSAMYRAKEQGRDGYRLYTPAMNAAALDRLALENKLRRALVQNELVVYYQPLLDLTSGRVHGVEALLRWRHPEMGLVSPAEFIPIAEVTGLIFPMGPFVLRAACAQAKAWQQRGQAHLCVSVNLSARQFQQSDLVSQVTQALHETGLDPRFLDLEITETNAMQSAELTIHILRELKALGVRISIDDFGIGYSSLSYLKRLPIDTLKIDKSFVRDITTDPDDAAIVTAVIVMAQTLKLRVVAEGVETEEQLSFLGDRRCDVAQGYLLSPPLPPEECEEVIARKLLRR